MNIILLCIKNKTNVKLKQQKKISGEDVRDSLRRALPLIIMIKATPTTHAVTSPGPAIFYSVAFMQPIVIGVAPQGV